ncbi:transcription factor IIIB 70 kDa subunit [[Candida] anglica]|uniref:B-related factor 1 n=1 Tax=[Candida] anglica TaxID=148631 RepID=A0ABP0ELX6_9ASCO
MPPKRADVCKNCGHSGTFSINRYTGAGDISCSRCGAVHDENPIVSEVQFGESSSGAAMVQGAMVGQGEARAPSSGNRLQTLESREQTLKNARGKIKKISVALRIPDHITEAANEWFRLALINNFVQGRRSQNVLAACLYVACRKERTHHMLIDFSSLLQISVYSLGATFLKMVKELHVTKLPLADPSIFIQHFAEKLEFGNMVTKVAKDASKLAQRMSNDWIHEGRRPAGIAGACILLAARMNNFRRSHAEIVEVAHVAEETLQKRLNEFKSTNSGNLTVKQIRDGEKVEAIKPPSFTKNRELELKLKKRIENNEGDLTNFNNRFTERELDDKEFKSKNDMKPKESKLKDDLMRNILKGCDISEKEIQDYCTKALKRQADHLKKSLYQNPSEKTDAEIEEARIIELNRPRNLVKYLPKTSDMLAKVASDKDNFDDINDDEMDEFVLNPEEVELKERLWTGLNQDFLIAQEKKRLKEEADMVTGNTSGATKKRRRKTEPLDGFPADGDLANQIGMKNALHEVGVDESGEPLTAADSATRMLAKTKFSKKINYSVVDNLFSSGDRGGDNKV